MTPRTFSVEDFDKQFPDTATKTAAPLPTEQPNQYGALFRATGNENPLEAGLKATGNVPTSAFNLSKSLYTAVTNPIETTKGAINLLADFGAIGSNKLTELTGLGEKRDQKTLRAAKDVYFGEQGRYGSLNQALKTAIEDPFGVGSDILSIFSGVAGATGRTSALSNTISKTAQLTTNPVTKVFSGFGRTVSSGTRFGASQATGLSPETISTITKNRKTFSEAQASGATRTDLAEDVLGAVKTAQDELSDLGSGYQVVRDTAAQVAMPENWLQSSLDKYGLKYQNLKVSADRKSATRNVTDINKIQEFIDNWGDSRTLTPEEYLNMRHDLAELAKYDMSGKSTVVRQFAQDVREGVLNSDKVRGQVPGLKELDTKYSADITFLNKIEKDFIDPKTGGLKDGAASKVVNAINTANPERLARLEQLYPGFTKQAKVVKAVEDVENAMGLKVGTYARAGLAIGGVMTGNVPVIVAAILSTPEIAVPLLKGYGYTAEKVGPILQAVTHAASDINNFRVPGAVEEYLKNYQKENGMPAGMSIKSSVTPEKVAANIDAEDFVNITKFMEDPQGSMLDDAIMRTINEIGIGNADEATQLRFLREVTDIADGTGRLKSFEIKD